MLHLSLLQSRIDIICTVLFSLQLLPLLLKPPVRSRHSFPSQQKEKGVMINEYHRAVVNTRQQSRISVVQIQH